MQNAAVDLHGLTVPAGFTRNFYTKYDYSSYEYLHKAQGVYGSTYGAWTIVPNEESLVGGPTKQNLIFTNNILIMEALSSHLDNNLVYTPPQGVATTRLFGPYYFHFNVFDSTHTTPASLYAEAQSNVASFNQLYDADTLLTGLGYQASTGRGTVAPVIAGGGAATANTAWSVLSDQATNFQYSAAGNQYWTTNNAAGNAKLNGVTPWDVSPIQLRAGAVGRAAPGWRERDCRADHEHPEPGVYTGKLWHCAADLYDRDTGPLRARIPAWQRWERE